MSGETKHTDESGYTYTLDSDGDRLYCQPESWSLDKDPDEMNVKEMSAAVARLLGCEPEWWPFYMDWVCSCDGNEHGLDSQCSIIADFIYADHWARRLAQWMEEQGAEVPKATASPGEICRAALRVGR